ncbi:MAG: hypothetical protein ABJM43_09415 [Paracoccaceae bacterium]
MLRTLIVLLMIAVPKLVDVDIQVSIFPSQQQCSAQFSSEAFGP